jgi:hypothetical protein
MVYEFAKSIARQAALGLGNIVDYINRDLSRQRASVRRYRTLTCHLIYPASENSTGLMGPDGFAAIPIAAIDPPQRAASPAVPALLGPGPLAPYAASLGSVDVISAIF